MHRNRGHTIARRIQKELFAQLVEFPVVTVLGPQQAGKTTLVRGVLPEYVYVSLEDPENRSIEEEAPRAFLKRFPGKTILNEIQRVPHLLSYLQGIVDEENEVGRFVLTGSHQNTILWIQACHAICSASSASIR